MPDVTAQAFRRRPTGYNSHMKITIWHNPRCSKSRTTLGLLLQHGFEPHIVEYLKTPPTAAEIGEVCRKLGIAPRQLLRTGEAEYKSLGLADQKRNDAEILAAMAANPVLIERPVVIRDARAALGRPPEAVLAIL